MAAKKKSRGTRGNPEPPRPAPDGPPAQAAAAPPADLGELTRRLLLEQFAPAAVLVNCRNEILYYFGPCARYLEIPAGHPTLDLIRVARDEFRTRLRGALHRAVHDGTAVALAGIPVRRCDAAALVRATVTPVQTPGVAEELLLVTFQDEAPAGRPPSPPCAEGPAGPAEDDALRNLEQELWTTRDSLQGTVEKLESANEELKAFNEEILSMNEELQSANGELVTSRKQLQTLNDELGAVNRQLREKVGELEQANNDIANLLRCTDIPTVFLDAALRVKLFTPAAARLLRLTATDVGRPVEEVSRRFADPTLPGDAERVLRQFQPSGAEVAAEDGSWWARRVTPYRTRDDRIDGVVITFVDVTERKKAADAVVRRLAALVEGSADAIFCKDLDGTIRTWNRGAERLYGYTPGEAVGRSVEMLVPDDRAGEFATIMGRLRRGESVEQLETERVQKDGRRIPVSVTISPLRDGGGGLTGASVIGRDITERRRAEQDLRDREARLQAILDTAMDAIITIDHHGLIRSVNAATERMFGYAAAELLGQNVSLLMPAPHREAHDRYLEAYLRTGEKRVIGRTRETEARRKDGTVFPAELAVSEIAHLKLFTGIHHDLTQRRRLERDLVEVAAQQQQRIGQDLHDTVAQELTALTMLAKDLEEVLQTDPAQAAPLVERMGQGLRRSRQELRAVLHGLLPVAVDREGLMAALADLAERTRREGKAACTFDCPEPVTLADNLTATHLYLIAQEAVHNALKHGRPRTVRVGLRANHQLVLRVECDGVGMPAGPPATEGLGLRIMRSRAAIIGATLTIGPAAPTGTVVTCALPRNLHER